MKDIPFSRAVSCLKNPPSSRFPRTRTAPPMMTSSLIPRTLFGARRIASPRFVSGPSARIRTACFESASRVTRKSAAARRSGARALAGSVTPGSVSDVSRHSAGNGAVRASGSVLPRVNRYIARARRRQQSQHIRPARLHMREPVDNRDGLNLHVLARQQKCNGHQIVGPRIRIDDDRTLRQHWHDPHTTQQHSEAVHTHLIFIYPNDPTSYRPTFPQHPISLAPPSYYGA